MKGELQTATTISAPARIHFGLFSVGNKTQRRFGGAGMMIDQPRTIVRVKPAEGLLFEDEASQRALLAPIRAWFANNRHHIEELGYTIAEELPLEFKLIESPPAHCGFGSGTQKALATAMAIYQMLELPTPSAVDLAGSVERGKRSAIGSHGFRTGGFLVDEGKLPGEVLAPLDLQLEFPEDWRVVTLYLPSVPSVFGNSEIQAFDNLRPTTEKQRASMVQLMKETIVPSLVAKDFDTFAKSLYEFGFRSGSMFSEIQGGPYNGDTTFELVELTRKLGYHAVGQSSWGPCVYVITRSETEAERYVQEIQTSLPHDFQISICRGDNQGVRVQTSIVGA